MPEAASNSGLKHSEADHFKESFAILADLRREDVLTDVTLKTMASASEVRAHKLVLMSASDYFRTMFKSCFCEAGLDSITMPGCCCCAANYWRVSALSKSFP